MAVTINALEVENLKRIKAVKIEPAASGLTVIGGNNNQGKTSVLDAICWALGGERYRPSQPDREGSMVPASLHMTLSNGLIVERKGKNGSLKVTDPTGAKAGQTLLNEFVENLALDLPRFMGMSGREKADVLLKIIGVGEELARLDKEAKQLYDKRHTIGQIADQKKKYAEELIYFPDTPDEPISASDLIQQQQAILAQNGENQRKRENVKQLEAQSAQLQSEITDLERRLSEKRDQRNQVMTDLATAQRSVEDLQDENTAELEANISAIDEVNQMVRSNQDKNRAQAEAQEQQEQYDQLTQNLEDVREARRKLLNDADLPLAELSIVEGELTYRDQQWDNMSGSDQLRVAVAIIRKLNPQCGFVLLDKLEQMDLNTLHSFSAWLESEGLQAIATRVSTGDECSILIDDGYSIEPVAVAAGPKKWNEGEF